MMSRTEVVICGAGIAGIAAAYHLAVRQGMSDVLLVDARPPMSLTSDKSSEGYRNWWPGSDEAMVRLMNRSIDLLEEFAAESDNRILLNRRAYLIGALSGFGLVAAAASGELLALHVSGSALPDYAPSIHLNRYDDPAYVERMSQWQDSSQL
ncbi:MAG: FAD-dependent oxidoreductase [Chloroflexi bacterium]|nr:FAD-dependent oxidoreductase [Chloroflexota bacterium]